MLSKLIHMHFLSFVKDRFWDFVFSTLPHTLWQGISTGFKKHNSLRSNMFKWVDFFSPAFWCRNYCFASSPLQPPISVQKNSSTGQAQVLLASSSRKWSTMPMALQLSKGRETDTTKHITSRYIPCHFFFYGLLARTVDLRWNPLVTTSSIDKLNAIWRFNFIRFLYVPVIILHDRVTSGCDPGCCIGSERQPTVFCRLKGRSQEISPLEEAANGCKWLMPIHVILCPFSPSKIIENQRDRLIVIIDIWSENMYIDTGESEREGDN